MVELKTIAEDNFIDAFNLKLASGQERFVTHQSSYARYHTPGYHNRRLTTLWIQSTQ